MSLAFLVAILLAAGISLSVAASTTADASSAHRGPRSAAVMMVVSSQEAQTAFKCHDASSEATCTQGTEQGVTCLWTPRPRGCVSPWDLCANLSSAVANCRALPQCQFNEVIEVCTVNCDLIGDAAYCATNSYCTAYPNSNPTCTPRCRFAYDDQLSCNADVNCFWDVGATECREEPRQCLTAMSEGQCTANALCAWNTSASLCGFGCSIALSPGACATEQERCVWDFENNECLAQLPPLPPGPVPNPVCQYFTTEAQCSAQGYHCKWDTALLRCRIFSQNEIFCAGIDNFDDCQSQLLCQWIDGSCNVQCPLVENKDACAAIVSCEWRYDRCLHTCAYNSFLAVCEAHPGCVWDAAKSFCIPRCSQAVSPYRNCSTIPLCTVSDRGECVIGCKWPMNASQCATWPSPHPATTRCEWSESFGVCEEVSLTPAPTTPSPSPVSAHFLQIQCNNSGCAMPGCFSQRFPQNRCLGLQGQNASARVSCVRSSSGVAIALNFTVYEASMRCGGSNVASHLVLVDTCAANSAAGDFLEFKC